MEIGVPSRILVTDVSNRKGDQGILVLNLTPVYHWALSSYLLCAMRLETTRRTLVPLPPPPPVLTGSRV